MGTEEPTADPELAVNSQTMAEKFKSVLYNIKKNYEKILSMLLVGLTVLQPYHAAIAGSRFAIKRFGVPEHLSSIYVSKFHTSMHTLNMFGIIIVNIYMWFYGSKNLRFNPLISTFTNFFVSSAHIALLIAYLTRSHNDLTVYYWFSSASAFLYGMNQAMVASVGVEYLCYFICGLQFSGIGVTIYHSLFLSIFKLFRRVNVDYWILSIQLFLATSVSIASTILWNKSFGQGDLTRMIQGSNIQGDKEDEDKYINANIGGGNYIPTGVHIDSNRFRNGRFFKGRPMNDPRFVRRSLDSNGRGFRGLLGSGGRRSLENNSTYNNDYNIRTNQTRRSPSPRRSNSIGESPTREYYIESNAHVTGSDLTQEHSQSLENGAGVSSKHSMAPRRFNIFQSIKIARSPILMSAFSMSLAFFFYPAVAPYKLAQLVDAHKIDLSVLVAAALPTIAVCLLVLMEMGPNKKWQSQDWYWNRYWLLAIPYMFSCISFAVAMHYPSCKYARFVKNPFALAFLVDLLIACYSLLKSIGYTGAGMQEDKRNGTISTFNMMFSFLFLFTGVFWGSGYIRMYNRHTREDWPTRGMSFIKSFVYWLKYSFDEGFSNFTKIPTRDLMRDIVSVVS